MSLELGWKLKQVILASGSFVAGNKYHVTNLVVCMYPTLYAGTRLLMVQIMTALSTFPSHPSPKTYHTQNVLHTPSFFAPRIPIVTLCASDTITAFILAFTRITQSR
jgi:hypothetical protein